MGRRTSGSTLWVAIYILDNGYGRVSPRPLALPLATCFAAVSHSLGKARKQSTETATELMNAFSFPNHESASCANLPTVFADQIPLRKIILAPRR
jgi:hypothetical protein